MSPLHVWADEAGVHIEITDSPRGNEGLVFKTFETINGLETEVASATLANFRRKRIADAFNPVENNYEHLTEEEIHTLQPLVSRSIRSLAARLRRYPQVLPQLENAKRTRDKLKRALDNKKRTRIK